MTKLTFFNTTNDLLRLTGLKTNEELWSNGFNLDDWDYGFVTNQCYVDVAIDETGFKTNTIKPKTPYYLLELLTMMDGHCTGYEVVQYNGKFYYIVYHG